MGQPGRNIQIDGVEPCEHHGWRYKTAERRPCMHPACVTRIVCAMPQMQKYVATMQALGLLDEYISDLMHRLVKANLPINPESARYEAMNLLSKQARLRAREVLIEQGPGMAMRIDAALGGGSDWNRHGCRRAHAHERIVTRSLLRLAIEEDPIITAYLIGYMSIGEALAITGTGPRAWKKAVLAFQERMLEVANDWRV